MQIYVLWDTCLGFLGYADELILISASLCDLQAMLGISSAELKCIDVKVNVANAKLFKNLIGHNMFLHVNDVKISYVEIYTLCSFLARHLC